MSNNNNNTNNNVNPDVIPMFTNEYWANMIIDNDCKDSNGNVIKPWSGPRRYYNDVAMYRDIMLYFAKNAATKRVSLDKKGIEVMSKEPLQWLDLCHSLQLTSSGVGPYRLAEYDDEDNNFSSLLAWAREVVQADQQKGGTMNIYNDRMVIQNLSANYGWSVEAKLKIETTTYLTSDEATKVLVTQMSQLSTLLGLEGKGATGGLLADE